MCNARYFGLSILALALVSAGAFRAADKDDPKYTIKEVMKMAHTVEKGSTDPNLFQKVAEGKATKDEKAKLLELYSALPANKPPKGEADEWKKTTSGMVTAVKAVVDGKENAEKDLKKAVACMDCHKAFRPAPK
jgi:hypothetical protein